MASYNTSKIENWYNDFVTYKNKFDNDFYSDYTSSYIKKNYNDVNNRISRNLDSHYNKIKELYKSIDTYWKNLIDDIKNADAVMAGTQKSSSIHSSPVASALNSLPELKEYEVTLDTRFSSFLANTGASEINQWIEENITWENAVVCVTSLYSGGAKVWETIGDGIIWCSGMTNSAVTSIFSKEAAEKIQNFTMDAIAFDAVGTVNDFIYQGTELGRTVNAGATMKYDSEAAKTVTKIGQETFEFALSTAVTVLSGGTVPPGTVSAVLGLLSGIGESAEKNFQEEDRNFWGDAGEILISGGISSVDWYSKGQIGANVLNAGKMLLQKGGTKMFGELIKAGISQTKSEFSENGVKAFFNLLKNGAQNTIKDVDTWVESIGAAFNNVSYEKENGFQVDWENFAKESVVNFLFNYGSNSLMSKVFDFGTLNAKNLDTDLSTINVKSNDAAGKYNENFKSYMASNNINSNNVDAFEIYGSLDEQIAKTNRYIEKGNFVTLHVNSVDDIPTNVWETVNRPKIDDKDVVIITKNGEKFYWGEPVDAYMLKKTSNIGEQVDDIEKQLGINKNLINQTTNVEASDLHISESRIIEYEKAFGLNYTSDAHDKKMINIFETLARNSSNIPDENVAKIVRNIDSISKVERRFGIGEWDGTSAYGHNSVNMDSKLLDCSEDVINTVLMHEFGHAYYHTFNGDASNNYEMTLSDSKKQVITNAQKMLSENPEKYIDILRESQTVYYETVSETIKWYDIQRPQENIKIRDMVEKMYTENGMDSLSKMVYSAKKMDQVNEILANAGMKSAEVSEILNNKELTTQILQAQNNISNQQAHLDEIMSSYSEKADYRKLSSTINSMTQKAEHIDPVTGEKFYCTYSHSDSYWNSISQEDSYRRTYDELLADYFSLASNGRIEVLNKMEEMFGSELMDSIRGEFKLIVDELDKRGLLIN